MNLRFDLPYFAHTVDMTGRRVYSLSPLNMTVGWVREIPLCNLLLSSGTY